MTPITNFKKIYTLGFNNELQEYDLEENPRCLYMVDDNSFSNEYGNLWAISEYNKTWSDDKATMLSLNYETFRKKALIHDNIRKVTMSDLNETDKLRLISALTYGFYGSIWGRDLSEFQDGMQYLSPESIGLGVPNHVLLYGRKEYSLDYWFGFPGPDVISYKISDYGKTWALTGDELKAMNCAK